MGMASKAPRGAGSPIFSGRLHRQIDVFHGPWPIEPWEKLTDF